MKKNAVRKNWDTLIFVRKLNVSQFFYWCLSLFIFITPVYADINTGLVGHWTFDDGSGTVVADSSGNNNTGTLIKGPVWTKGRVGSGALTFGEGSVKLTSLIATPGTFSASLWIYPKDVSYAAGNLIGGLNTNSQLRIGSIMSIRDNGAAATDFVISKPLFDNKWQHLVVTRDATNAVVVYLDGTNVTPGTTPTFSIIKYWDYIGNLSNGASPFLGSLDDLRIYERVLSSDEITVLYNMGVVVPSGDTQAPTVPTALSASALSSNQINISWNASSDNVGVKGYQIYRGNAEIADIAQTSYQDNNLSANTPYTYTVLAYDAQGNQSTQALSVSATTQQSANPVAPSATEWYVSPTGSSAGDGSIHGPWDLQTAFNGAGKRIKPGHTIWLRGGVYDNGGNAVFGSRWDVLSGTEGNPITFRNYAGERAIVNGSINVTGTYLTFWGFEIMNSNPVRKISIFEKPAGITIGGKENKVINVVIHDVGHPGIGGLPEGEIYGVIMWGNGIYDLSNPSYPDGWIRGSGMYLQNRYGNTYVSESISFKEFTSGMKAYAQEGHVNGFKFEGNVVFDNNDIALEGIGITNPIQDISWIENYSYTDPFNIKKPAQLGWVSTDMISATVRGNYFVNGSNPKGALFVHKWKNLNVSDNTFISQRQASGIPVMSFDMPDTTGVHTWNNNKYFGGNSISQVYLNNISKTWDQWKSETGFDRDSFYSAALPEKNHVVVRPNKYEKGRAHIIVYNWENKDQVSVDISSAGLQSGDKFSIYDVQNFLGQPVLKGIYDAQPVILPMDLTTITPLVGAENIVHFNPNSHTDKKFNVFVLIKTSLGSISSKTSGDISGDGKVTMYDAALVLRFALGSSLTDDQEKVADYNTDGKIDGADVVAIARKAVGL